MTPPPSCGPRDPAGGSGGCTAALRRTPRRSSGVSSVEPSSTITHSAGGTVCFATLSIVRARVLRLVAARRDQAVALPITWSARSGVGLLMPAPGSDGTSGSERTPPRLATSTSPARRSGKPTTAVTVRPFEPDGARPATDRAWSRPSRSRASCESTGRTGARSRASALEQARVQAVEPDAAQHLLAADRLESIRIRHPRHGLDNGAVDEREPRLERHGHARRIGIAQQPLPEEQPLLEHRNGGQRRPPGGLGPQAARTAPA